MGKYIVTGCAGFIGSNLVDRLLKDGHEVIGFDNLSSGLRENLPLDNKNFTFHEMDIRHWGILSNAFNADGVFHVAANARIQPSIQDPELSIENIQMTFEILELMRMWKIKNIVYSSSSSIYGRNEIPFTEDLYPDCLTPYGLSKKVGEDYIELYCKLYGFKGVSLRYFNVWGPREVVHIGQYSPLIGLFFKQALLNKTPLTIIGDGEQRRDVTYVDDVVEANIKAMEHIEGGMYGSSTEEQYCLFNIGSGHNYSINDIARMVLKSLHLPQNYITHLPARVGESRETSACIDLADEFMHWRPSVYNMQDAIDEHRDYYFKKWNKSFQIK